MLKKCGSISDLVKKNSATYLKRTNKFRIECPISVEDTVPLDKQNGNAMWSDEIAKEMKNV